MCGLYNIGKKYVSVFRGDEPDKPNWANGANRQIRRICRIGQMGLIRQMSQICPIGTIRIIADKGRTLDPILIVTYHSLSVTLSLHYYRVEDAVKSISEGKIF